jgi:hypothetical protein
MDTWLDLLPALAQILRTALVLQAYADGDSDFASALRLF